MPQFDMSIIYAALPEVFLAVMAMTLLMVGVFVPEKQATRSVGGLTLVSFAITFILMLTVASPHVQMAFPYGGDAVAPAGYFFISDTFSFYLKTLILLAAGLSVLISPDYLKRKGIAKFEYYVLMVLSVVGMMLMVSANNLLTMYIGLELMSFSLYILAAFNRDNRKSSEAGLKYFVMGSVASGMLLYGMSMFYGVVGDLSFPAIGLVLFSPELSGDVIATLGLVFMLVALAFKISAVPFHMWTPDVYEGAPTPVTAFMSAAPKVAAVGLLIRFLAQPMAAMVDQWNQILIVMSLLSMSVGAIMAIVQTNLKRLLAYSSIGHIGFMLVGLVGGTASGLQAVVIYLTIYALMTLGAFGGLMLLQQRGSFVETIDDIAGLARHAPGRAFMILIFMFSLAGIPPLAGFFGKLYVFAAAVQAGYTWLAVVGVLLSVVGAYYCLRVVKAMYFDEGRKQCEDEVSAPLQTTVILLAIVVAALGIGLGWLDVASSEAVISLLL